MVLVFSYGTLRQTSVQQAIFGRTLVGESDAVAGHYLTSVVITDPEVIASSGSAVHPMLVPSEDPTASVPGTVYDLDDDQLRAADAYEVSDYERVRVTLTSGRSAWVYALAGANPERA